MAETKQCSSCGQTVPFDARFCPTCGAQFVAHRVSPKKAGCLKVAGIGLAGLFGIGIVGSIIGESAKTGGNLSTITNTADAENSSDAAVDKKAEDHRVEMAMAAGQAIKSSMRNPDSLVIEQGLASDDAKLICVEYRAQNGFGGMNREFTAFKDGRPHSSAIFWNAHCRKPLKDVTYFVKSGTSLRE